MGEQSYAIKQTAGVMPKKYQCFGVRHLQLACMCLTTISLFIARGSMGVAVLAMAGEGRKNDTQAAVAVYDWDKNTQSLILSSFFWGYVTMQIPAGLLANKFGGKIILLAALIVNGVLCIALPTLAALGGWPLVCMARVAMGLSQACLFPASQSLFGQWLPPNEITSYSGIVSGGVQIGTIIAMPVSGLLAETALGWKLIFYTMSGLLFVNAAIWYWFSASTPGEHRMISKEERQYIENGLQIKGGQRKMATPWKQIFRCVPIWAILATHISSAISFVLFFVDMPTYLEKGLKISLKNSASLSALPYIGMWIGNTCATVAAEKLTNKKIISVGTCRKIFNSLGMFGISGGLVFLSLLGPENKGGAIVALVATLTMSGFCNAGYGVNYLDMAPNFAGLLFSLTNCVANFGSVLIPIVTSLILRNDSSDLSRWRVVFLMVAALAASTNIIYVIFSSSERQPWNDPDYFDKQADPEEMKPVLTEQQSKNKEKENEAYRH
ncbi:putative inorganic phosphate cotransporter isoform X1 [Ostrinia furnacalis]|uniref:putative inorganic phosphate cotransporter isoform X1 n=1 Tax=Ostrinia furnacalis TaxID=93504 RepID=UPI00103EF7A2|nr:putative inorganic phosphate cotransporter isoform X1 [Ostrinia furnacalis]